MQPTFKVGCTFCLYPSRPPTPLWHSWLSLPQLVSASNHRHTPVWPHSSFGSAKLPGDDLYCSSAHAQNCPVAASGRHTLSSPPMSSLLSSSLCEDAQARLIFLDQFFACSERGQYANPRSNPPDCAHTPLCWQLLRRQAESASDDLLSVPAPNWPDTQYCVRPEALKGFSGERFHLTNGPMRKPRT